MLVQQRHSCVCTQHEYDTTHKDYTADLSNGFAVTDEDLQRAIDDTEIEEKLPNEPKGTVRQNELETGRAGFVASPYDKTLPIQVL